jgi:hypothetical protein
MTTLGIESPKTSSKFSHAYDGEPARKLTVRKARKARLPSGAAPGLAAFFELVQYVHALPNL